MTHSPLSRAQLLIMAVTTGTTIANIYYAQPILAQIGASFGSSAAGVGFLPALSQWGMALGILFIVPLGDMLDRKRLVVTLELALGVVLIAMTATRDIQAAGAISLLIGVCTAAVQVVVPMAASLAAPNERGRVIGLVFTGTLIGILSSRIVSGFLADWMGWRLVYALSAAQPSPSRCWSSSRFHRSVARIAMDTQRFLSRRVANSCASPNCAACPLWVASSSRRSAVSGRS